MERVLHLLCEFTVSIHIPYGRSTISLWLSAIEWL